MTDFLVGTALWNDLVRQVAGCSCDCDDAEHLLSARSLNLVCSQAKMPVDNRVAFPRRALVSDNRRHSRAFKNLAMTQQLEDFASLQNEDAGTPSRLAGTKVDLDNLQLGSRQMS